MNEQTPERLPVQTPAIEATAFLLPLVRSIVRRKNDAQVYWATEQGCTVIDVEVHQSDVGRLIGYKGENARAIRSIVAAISAQNGAKYDLNLPHPEKVKLRR